MQQFPCLHMVRVSLSGAPAPPRPGCPHFLNRWASAEAFFVRFAISIASVKVLLHSLPVAVARVELRRPWSSSTVPVPVPATRDRSSWRVRVSVPSRCSPPAISASARMLTMWAWCSRVPVRRHILKLCRDGSEPLCYSLLSTATWPSCSGGHLHLGDLPAAEYHSRALTSSGSASARRRVTEAMLPATIEARRPPRERVGHLPDLFQAGDDLGTLSHEVEIHRSGGLREQLVPALDRGLIARGESW